MFRRLTEEVLEATAAWDPAWASTEGLHAFDTRLADRSPDAYAARLRDVRAWLARLEDTPEADPLDRDALRFALALEEFELADLRTFQGNPDLASEFMDHLLPLLLRRSMTPTARADAIHARLAGAGAFLAAGKRRIVPARVPPLWVEIAVESAEQAPAFLAAVKDAVAGASAGSRAEVEHVAERAEESLRAFTHWLEHDLAPAAEGEWAIGEAAFDGLLERRGFPESAAYLWKRGHEIVDRFREEARDAAGVVLARAGRTPHSEPVQEAMAIVAADHPATFADVLEAYRTAIAASRNAVRDLGVASVPDVPVDVVETPSYLRHLVPFAAYIQPPRFGDNPRGTYLVTPKVDLAAFPLADVRNTTVHEAFPGHHLQLSVARETPSLARFLVRDHAPEMFEGWALYCEEVMGRHGFTASPEERLVRAKDALWRAVRIVLDVGLHTGRLTFDDAVAMLTRETGMTQAEADAEVKRYTLSPGYNLSYMYGRLRFESARAEAEAEPGFSEKAWHDRLLRQGSLPLHLLFEAAKVYH